MYFNSLAPGPSCRGGAGLCAVGQALPVKGPVVTGGTMCPFTTVCFLCHYESSPPRADRSSPKQFPLLGALTPRRHGTCIETFGWDRPRCKSQRGVCPNHTHEQQPLHTHALPHAQHCSPFSPPLIVFLYLTFKVPEIGKLPNSNLFLQGSASWKIDTAPNLQSIPSY